MTFLDIGLTWAALAITVPALFVYRMMRINAAREFMLVRVQNRQRLHRFQVRGGPDPRW